MGELSRKWGPRSSSKTLLEEKRLHSAVTAVLLLSFASRHFGICHFGILRPKKASEPRLLTVSRGTSMFADVGREENQDRREGLTPGRFTNLPGVCATVGAFLGVAGLHGCSWVYVPRSAALQPVNCVIPPVEGDMLDAFTEQSDKYLSSLLREAVDAGPKSLEVKVEHVISVRGAGQVVRYRRKGSTLYSNRVARGDHVKAHCALYIPML
jgi:hypothetical protein